MVWFTDLGSGNLHELQDLNAVITDHHVPSQREIPLSDRKDLLTLFNAVEKNTLHLNPHLFGRDGARDISGAGTAYLVAKALNQKNIDLSALAIVGAVGDLQSIENRRLIGTNRDILNDGGKAGVLSWKIDIQFFGRETRPVFKLLQYANDPLIPKLTGNKENCIDFLLGEVYILQKEEGALRAAKEFATLLNSCGRYEKADIGYQICLGDRDKWLKKAESLLLGHRKTLVKSLQFIKEIGITEKRYIQYFHGKDEILDSVIGITASMLLGSGEINQKLPIFAFANTKEGIKVSARSTRSLISKGLDLSIVMKEASKQVGGHGGGHNIAAGATIPYGTEEEFLDTSEEIIRKQLGK
jgi:RecJ-like exonuclease